MVRGRHATRRTPCIALQRMRACCRGKSMRTSVACEHTSPLATSRSDRLTLARACPVCTLCSTAKAVAAPAASRAAFAVSACMVIRNTTSFSSASPTHHSYQLPFPLPSARRQLTPATPSRDLNYPQIDSR